MTAVRLLLVFVTAKLIVLAAHPVAWSGWSMVAFFWQDSLVVLLFGLLIAGADRLHGPFTNHRRLQRWIYWILVLYAVVNIPIERALFTPLTWPMIRATGGPLADSLLHYATATNALLMALTIVVAAL